METPSDVVGQDNGKAQLVVDANGNIISVGSAGRAAPNAFNNIALGNGQTGLNFNIAEAAYPVTLVSARMLLNSAESPHHTQGIAIPTSNASTSSPLGFGNVLVGQSKQATLTISNTGAEGSELSGTFPAASGDFGPQDASPFGPLAATDAANQEYAYAPTTRGTNTQTITVTTDAGNLPVTLSGTGVAPVTSINQSNAGYTLVTQTKTATVTVKNVGDGNLSGAGDVSNLNGSVAAGSGSFSGDGGDVSLTDNTSQSFDYTYAPTMRGAASAVVAATFTNGNPDGTNSSYSQDVTITGTGVAPVQSIDISAINVGLVRIGTTGTAGITVNNIGDGNLSGLGDTSNLAGTVSAGITQFTGGGSVSLKDGASKTFDFTYTPTSHTTDSTSITIALTNGSSDGKNLAQTVTAPISGQGVGPIYSSSHAPNSVLDFGTTTGSPPPPLTLDITNASTDDNGGDATLTDLTLLSAAISGDSSSLFSVADFVAGTVLHAGDLLNLQIDYTGDVGMNLATLTIATDQSAALGASGTNFVYQLTANGAVLQPTPEPSTLWLLGTGAIGLFAVRRRRQRSATRSGS